MKIVYIDVKEIYSDGGTAGLQVRVWTEDGSMGCGVCSEALPVGRYEYPLPLDGGTRMQGMGLLGAAEYISCAAKALVGMDAADQEGCDALIQEMDWAKMGAIGATALSEAVLKAHAQSSGRPLYRCIREAEQYKLPVPTYVAAMGSTRYGRHASAGGKPAYLFAAYGYSTFSDAVYALWETASFFAGLLSRTLGIKTDMDSDNMIPPDRLKSDEQLLALMAQAIRQTGQESRVGIAVDLAADHYYDPKTGLYQGLLEDASLTREALIEKLIGFDRTYPIVLFQDPLQADDFAGCAELARSVTATVAGHEMFAGRADRLEQGMALSACQGLSIIPAHLGTISAAQKLVRCAQRNGLVLCTSGGRSEDIDAGDHAVGLDCDVLMGCGLSFLCNRLLAIESELGPKAQFAGPAFCRTNISGK